MKKLPTLYKLDSKGKTREWTICYDANEFWSAQGIVGMKIRKNNPTSCEGKNLGRVNETTAEEQAVLEAKAKWEKKRKDGYTQDINKVKTKKFFEPMLAQNYPDRIKGLEFPLFVQPKLDGIRCIIRKEEDKVVARTRNGRIIDAIPHIIRDLEGFFLSDPTAILDGELYNHSLKEDFNKIISLVRKQNPVRSQKESDKSFKKKQEDFKAGLEESAKTIEYWVYDAPLLNGMPSSLPFSVRFVHLEGALSNKNYLKVVPTTEVRGFEQIDAIYERFISDGYEGQMIREDSGYENKRSKSLLKRKDFQDAEYKVLDIDEGNGNRKGTAKHLVCWCAKTKQMFHSNIKGNFEYLAEILENKEYYIGKYATIKFFQLTPDGVPRFPYAIAFRDYE